MPLDDLPGKYIAPKRSDIAAQFKRDITTHDPTISTDDGTLADIDAATTADSLAPIFYDAQLAANAAASLDDMSLTQLRNLAQSIGLPDLLPATGASGFSTVSAASGGGFIPLGATCTNELTNIQYQSVSASGTFQDQSMIELIALAATGPQTDIAAGTVLKWDSPQAGISPKCIVLVNSAGGGLSGGSPIETQQQIIERIKDAYASPPAAGNDAAIRDAAKKTPGVAVEETWSYPAIWGSGTTSYVFTVRPQTLPDGSPIPSTRIPTGVQLSLVGAWVEGPLPGDDGPIPCPILPISQNLSLAIVWDSSSDGWEDNLPWPNWSTAKPVQIGTATSAVAFTLDCSGAPDIGGTQLAPQPGMHIAFFNKSANAFVRKTILTASITTGSIYAIVCDQTFGASDTIYKPSVGEWCCPWSDSLSVLVPIAYTMLAELGPGEQVAPPFFDSGTRWKRQPFSPAQWPSVIGQRALNGFNTNAAIDDASFLFPAVPFQTTVGVKAVSSNMFIEGGIFAFAQ